MLDVIDPSSARHIQARLALIPGNGNFIASHLTIMECLVRPRAQNDLLAEAKVLSFFDATSVVRIDERAFDLAATLRARHALKTPDALHAACAIVHGCDEIWTYDARLLKATLPVRVVAP